VRVQVVQGGHVRGVHVLCVLFFLFWWVLEIGGGRVGGRWVLGLGLLRHEVGGRGFFGGLPETFLFLV